MWLSPSFFSWSTRIGSFSIQTASKWQNAWYSHRNGNKCWPVYYLEFVVTVMHRETEISWVDVYRLPTELDEVVQFYVVSIYTNNTFTVIKYIVSYLSCRMYNAICWVSIGYGCSPGRLVSLLWHAYESLHNYLDIKVEVLINIKFTIQRSSQCSSYKYNWASLSVRTFLLFIVLWYRWLTIRTINRMLYLHMKSKMLASDED